MLWTKRQSNMCVWATHREQIVSAVDTGLKIARKFIPGNPG